MLICRHIKLKKKNIKISATKYYLHERGIFYLSITNLAWIWRNQRACLKPQYSSSIAHSLFWGTAVFERHVGATRDHFWLPSQLYMQYIPILKCTGIIKELPFDRLRNIRCAFCCSYVTFLLATNVMRIHIDIVRSSSFLCFFAMLYLTGLAPKRVFY